MNRTGRLPRPATTLADARGVTVAVALCAVAFATAGCEGVAFMELSQRGANSTPPSTEPDASTDPNASDEPLPPFVPAPSHLRALTRVQLENTLRDLFGEPLEVAVPPSLDLIAENFSSVGASHISLTGNTVEKLETLALSVTSQVFSNAARRKALLGCEPSAATDPCVRTFLAQFGARAWRRPLSSAELDVLSQKASELSTLLGDHVEGIRYTVVAVLISPNFMYLPQVGEDDPSMPGRVRYTGLEMASRLSYLIWNSAPDAELLAAAQNGQLLTPEGIRAQAQRMLAVEAKSRPAIRHYFAEYLGLNALETLNKDTSAFPLMTPTMAASMRGELDRALDDLIFTRSADLRELFSVRSTFVNGELATLYGLPPPETTEPTAVTIQAAGTNLWFQADSFHFVSRRLTGDGEIVARVDSLTSQRSWAKAVVMFREDLTPGARHALVAVTPGNGTAFKFRMQRDGLTDYRLGPAHSAPYWVRLRRTGDQLTGSVSPDGQTWTDVHTITLAIGATPYVGVGYTNEDNSQVHTAQFSGIKVSGANAATHNQWTAQNVGDISAGTSTLHGAANYEAASFPQGQGRVGVLGFAGILARTSKSSMTSPTARGLYVRERLLCQKLPPPPPNVVTDLPPENPNAPRTTRERLAIHRENPACAGCHNLMDPIGLALENYDGIGVYRTTEHGLDIDASGELDGKSFVGLEQLMELLKSDQRANECLVRQLYRHATSHVETEGEERVIKELARPLSTHGATFHDLLLSIVTSDGFRFATRPH